MENSVVAALSFIGLAIFVGRAERSSARIERASRSWEPTEHGRRPL